MGPVGLNIEYGTDEFRFRKSVDFLVFRECYALEMNLFSNRQKEGY